MSTLTAAGCAMMWCVSMGFSTEHAPVSDLLQLGANLAVMLGALSLDRRRRPASVVYSDGKA